MTHRAHWIWLQKALGFGASQTLSLLETFGDAQSVYDATVYPTSADLTNEQRRRLADKDLTDAFAECEKLDALGAWMITPEDALYQQLFEGMFAPPVVMYGLGERFDPSDAPVVAVVGTRRHDEDGAVATCRLSAGLAAGGAVIVSGGAQGLDSLALTAALDVGGRCITFQACGIDVNYPKPCESLRRRLLENGGIVLTEFTTGLPAFRHHFKIRNRLIAASARGVLVTQAPIGSGAVMSANWAREQGRDVFAVPGAVGKECTAGSNELLKDGARLVTNAADILIDYVPLYPTVINIAAAVKAEDQAQTRYRRALSETDTVSAIPPSAPIVQKVAHPPIEQATPVPLPKDACDEARTIYIALERESKTASELTRETGLPIATVLSNLTRLELRGVIVCGPGQRYAIRTQ